MITLAPRRTQQVMRGLRAPVMQRRRHGLRALNYNDLMAQADLQNCSPMDSSCVSNNVAKQAAVEDYWVAHMHDPGGISDSTQLNFTPQTAAQVQEFYNPQNLAWGGNVVDTSGILKVSGPTGIMTPAPPPLAPNDPCATMVAAYKAGVPPPQVRVTYPAGPTAPVPNPEDIAALAQWSKCTGVKSTLPPLPNAPAPIVKTNAPASSTTTTPQGNIVQSSSSATTAPGIFADLSFPSFTSPGGFSLSSIPWWGWAVGIGGALFLFRKGGR